jgi:16S rRNA C967 or C1407 C5-methylase (RsmB/RsmF family)
VVDPFLVSHPEFSLAPRPEWAQAFAEGRFLSTRPEIHGGDAFFCAPLRRG